MDSRLPPSVNTLRSEHPPLVAFLLTIPFTGRFKFSDLQHAV